MVIGYTFPGKIADATGQSLAGMKETIRQAQQSATFTFLMVELDAPVRHVMGYWGYPNIEQFAERLVSALRVLEWWPDMVLAASWPGWHDRSWQLAAETVAQRLKLIWVALPWGHMPLLAASAAPTWHLPAPGMIVEAMEVARSRGLVSETLRIVGREVVW